MLRRIIGIAAVAMLALVALAACGEGNPTPIYGVTRIPCKNCPTPLPTPPPPGHQAAQATTSGAAAAQPVTSGPVTLDMEDIKFVPNTFAIPANTPVTIKLANKGAVPHNFSVTDHNNPNVKNLNISVTLQPGQSQDVTVNAPPGKYYFYCDQPGHETAGMYGTMTVVAATAAATSASPAAGASPPAPPAASPPPSSAASPPAAASPAAVASPAASPAASPSGAVAGAKAVTVDMEDIKFVPNQFTIPANTDVKITLDNKGALPHDFSVTSHKNPNVKNLNISVLVQPGQSKTITVNAPAGDYYFYCNQPGHEAAGMFGHMLVK